MAAATIVPFIPAGVTNGKQVAILTTTTALHTAVNSAGSFDAVTIEVHNTTAAPIALTLEWGGTSSPDLSIVTIPAADGWFPVAVARRAWGGIGISILAAAVGLRADVSVDRFTPAS